MASSHYCKRKTGRKDKDGRKEECGGEVKNGECIVCGTKK